MLQHETTHLVLQVAAIRKDTTHREEEFRERDSVRFMSVRAHRRAWRTHRWGKDGVEVVKYRLRSSMIYPSGASLWVTSHRHILSQIYTV